MEHAICICSTEEELTNVIRNNNVEDYIDIIYEKIIENDYSYIIQYCGDCIIGIGDYIEQNIENDEFITKSLNNNSELYPIYSCIIYHALNINRYDICQKIIDKNMFNNDLFSVMLNKFKYLYKFKNTDIIKLLQNTNNISDTAKLRVLFDFLTYFHGYTDEDVTELKNYIKDNYDLLGHLNYLIKNIIFNRTYYSISLNKVSFKLICEVVNINCNEIDEYILKNILNMEYGYKDLTECGYNFIRLKNEYLEVLCSRVLKYSCLNMIKSLVENGATISNNERIPRSGDSKIVRKYLIGNNIIN